MPRPIFALAVLYLVVQWCRAVLHSSVWPLVSVLYHSCGRALLLDNTLPLALVLQSHMSYCTAQQTHKHRFQSTVINNNNIYLVYIFLYM